MKWRGVLFLSLIILFSFASASVKVHNSSIQKTYFPFESLEGEMNLTIVGENFGSFITSSAGDNISVGEFLSENGASYTCSPSDCSKDYKSLGGYKDKIFNLSNSDFIGFFLEGENIEITGIDFNLSSDFLEEDSRPLSFQFFDDFYYNFNEFSSIFGARSYGCLDTSLGNSEGPLIRTATYCEKIFVYETGAVEVGAMTTLGDDKFLTMVLYSTTGSNLGECEFNPSSGEESCVIPATEGEYFPSEDYYVCVKSEDETNYRLFEGDSEKTCGFVYSQGIETSEKDYWIFSSSSKFANATALRKDSFDFERMAESADSLIQEKYNRNCSSGCFLPILFEGVSQNLRFFDVEINYLLKGEDKESDKIYLLEQAPADFDFSGVLDFSLTGFNISKPGKYSLYLGGSKFFEDTFVLVPAPIIKDVTPKNVPAGVPVTFVSLVDFDSNKSLSYQWSFSDGVKKETTEPFVIHTLNSIKNYTLSLKVSAGGNLTSEKEFRLNAISPKEVIDPAILERKTKILNVEKEINTFPSWYRDKIKSLVNLTYYKGEISRIEKARNSSFSDEDFLKVAIDLYKLDIPVEVFVAEQTETPILAEVEKVEPSVIKEFAGGGYEDNFEDYKKSIVQWQGENIQASIRFEKLSFKRISGVVESLMNVYSTSFTSHSDLSESYIVIDKPQTDLYFKDVVSARKINDSTVIVLPSYETLKFDFYYSSTPNAASFFVSPRLTSLVFEAKIDSKCNSNGICEPELGEDYRTCRVDCKPKGKALFYIFLALILGVVVYSIIQFWYRRHYENYLFDGDRRELYNLLMYVSNAQARGISYNQIAYDLRRQGWASERIDYVLRRVQGKRIGLPEIIPFSKISAHFRQKKARKDIVTESQQQFGRNINKSVFQGRV